MVITKITAARAAREGCRPLQSPGSELSALDPWAALRYLAAIGLAPDVPQARGNKLAAPKLLLQREGAAWAARVRLPGMRLLRLAGDQHRKKRTRTGKESVTGVILSRFQSYKLPDDFQHIGKKRVVNLERPILSQIRRFISTSDTVSVALSGLRGFELAQLHGSRKKPRPKGYLSEPAQCLTWSRQEPAFESRQAKKVI